MVFGEPPGDPACVPEAITLHGEAKSADVRVLLIQTLARIQSEAARDTLIMEVNSSHPLIRKWALWGLTRLRSQEALLALVEALDHPDDEISGRASFGLVEFGDKQMIGTLKSAAARAPTDRRRQIHESDAKRLSEKR